MTEFLDRESRLANSALTGAADRQVDTRYYWGGPEGQLFGTSPELALACIGGGVLVGFAFGIREVPTTVVAADPGHDTPLYIAMVEQGLVDHSQTRHGDENYAPAYLGKQHCGPNSLDDAVDCDYRTLYQAFLAYESILSR